VDVIGRLDGGLVLRRATAADAEDLAAFYGAAVFGTPERPDRPLAAWTRDLLTRPHPTFADGGFTVVQDPGTGGIVSALCLIPQTWSYAGVPFGVGRVELVGTLPAYRRRGLIRRQMEEVHRWSAALGHPVQVITGIANFYRQFGYEQGLPLGGGRGGGRQQIPALPAGRAEPFRVRPATAADAPFLAELEAQTRRRSLLSVPRDAALWRYEIEGRSAEHQYRRVVGVVEATGADVRPAGERVGLLVHPPVRGPTVRVTACELLPGVSWLAVAPSVLRYLKVQGDAWAPATPEDGDGRFDRLFFALGPEHPVYRALPATLDVTEPPHPQYVRVADLPAFLLRLGGVLEQRLAASVAVGFTGRLRLSFYRDGVLLRFREGRLAGVESCPHDAPGDATGPIGASFPGLSFLQLLCGARSIDELEHAFADCRMRTEEARVLLHALFPKHPSLIWAMS
jgi:GNAT superfamily N-acetyltransferase